MSQITIYLEEALVRKVRRRAKAEGLSVSKWIAKTIESAEHDSWPAHVRDSFGSWSGVPDLKAIRSSYGKDAPRERLD